jgi:hypothetical protein
LFPERAGRIPYDPLELPERGADRNHAQFHHQVLHLEMEMIGVVLRFERHPRRNGRIPQHLAEAAAGDGDLAAQIDQTIQSGKVDAQSA